LLLVAAIVLIAMPLAYLVVLRTLPKDRKVLLMVSTDDVARKLVKVAARRVGYWVEHVYRYEDGLQKLRENNRMTMIIIDDSVPQYETGLMLSMLRGSAIGVRPLILIIDNSELGLTAPSYRAEVVLSRPLAERSIEDAIRQVAERVELTP
jgi:DNA-binding response OmpR family regulator